MMLNLYLISLYALHEHYITVKQTNLSLQLEHEAQAMQAVAVSESQCPEGMAGF